jgi:hypothetical protein
VTPPLLGFYPQFADAVLDGTKRQTIRAYRKKGRDPEPGDVLHLWTGLRTKGARKLADHRCQEVLEIEIAITGAITLDGRLLDKLDARQLARHDGFPITRKLVEFFADVHGLPFRGILIRW